MRRRSFLRLSAGVISAVPVGATVGAATFRDEIALAAPAGRSQPDFIVALDGSGDATTIQAAIDAAPSTPATPSTPAAPSTPATPAAPATPSTPAAFGAAAPPIHAAPPHPETPRKFVIGVRPGTYLGQVIVPASKQNIELRGLGRRPEDVVIADSRANGTPKPDGSGTWGTSGSASVTVSGAGFAALNLTFANLFDEAGHPEISGQQAVAVLTRADRLEFERVRFLGNQDTLYVNSSAADVIARVYLRDCYVEGDVDFIFGRATAVFDRCHVHSLARNSTPAGYVTAPSTSITNPHGLLFTRCRFTSDAPAGSVFLGRPWHPSQDPDAIGQTIIRDSIIGAHIGPTAWSDFGTWSWRDARFAEYRNIGPGARPSADRPQLTRAEAAAYTVDAFLRGSDDWRPEFCK